MMKRNYFIIFLVLMSILGGTTVQAVSTWGPKALGMGGAYSTIANDPSSIYWNPAGLGQLDSYEFMYSLGLSSTDSLDLVARLNPARFGEVLTLEGIRAHSTYYTQGTVMMLGSTQNVVVGLTGFEQRRRSISEGIDQNYSELIFNLGTGHRFPQILVQEYLKINDLYWGMNVQYAGTDYSEGVLEDGEFYHVNDSRKVADYLGVNMGILAEITPDWRTSLVVRNFKMYTNGLDILGQIAPEQYVLGSAYHMSHPWVDYLACDVEYNRGRMNSLKDEIQDYTIIRLGGEKGILDGQLVFRGGLYTPLQATKVQFADKLTLTSGVGYNWCFIKLDLGLSTTYDLSQSQMALTGTIAF